MSVPTPAEAADAIERYADSCNAPLLVASLRVLADHARATTPGDRDRGRELAALAASWDENAAEERRTMGRPSVSVDEAVSGPYVADTWEQAASELRTAVAAPAETETTSTDQETQPCDVSPASSTASPLAAPADAPAAPATTAAVTAAASCATGTDPLAAPAETEAGDRITDWPERPSNAAIARMFHEEYERLAPLFGYRTREESAKPWDEVPEPNRLLMGATVGGVMIRLFGDAPDDPDPLAATPPAPEGEAGDFARIRHIVWSHLAAVHTVTPPDPDGTRAFYSSDVREPLSSAQLAERIARDLAATSPVPGGGQGATEGGVVPDSSTLHALGGFLDSLAKDLHPLARTQLVTTIWSYRDSVRRIAAAMNAPAPAGPQAEGAGETEGGQS